MTKTLRNLKIRQSELRQKTNELLGFGADLSDEQRAELATLSASLQGMETEIRAAMLIEPEHVETSQATGGEGEEFRALLARADIAGIFGAALTGHNTTGAEKELQEHLGMGANQVPLELLRPVESRLADLGDVEHRTAGVTPAPTDVGAMQRPIIPAVFPQSVTAFLQIAQDTVPVGEAIYTTLSTSANPGTPAKGAEQAHSTGAFTPQTLTPGRIQASVFYAREDAARLVGLSEALRMNLSDALADELDKQVVMGDPEGLLHGTVLGNHNVSAVTTFALYRSQLAYARVDGKFASETSELRAVLGGGTHAHAGEQYRGNQGDVTALDSLKRMMGGVRVSAHVPAVASNKQNALIRIGNRMDYACAIWQGVSLIVDEITQAKAGEVVLTAIMLYACKLLRADGFFKQQTQHA